MNKLLALFASIVALSAFSSAQLVQSATPGIGEVYRFAWSSSGNAYSLTDIPIYQAHFNLPFGLDFDAGHAVVYGQAMKGTEFVGNAFGYELYVAKAVGGDGAFVRFSADLLIGNQKPDLAFTAGIGFKF